MVLNINSDRPDWPSLYNPGREIIHIEHRDPVQPGASYVRHVGDVFTFTFFWTLLFHTPVFVFCGAYAFLNISFPPVLSRVKLTRVEEAQGIRYVDEQREDEDHEHDEGEHEEQTRHGQGGPEHELYQLTQRTNSSAHQLLRLSSNSTNKPKLNPGSTSKKRNEKRSRLTFSLLVFLAFLAFGLAGAALGSTVIGLLLFGLYKAGGYNMSTFVFSRSCIYGQTHAKHLTGYL
jgi:hypothetical protein